MLELAAAFIQRWWKVDPEVLAYVQCRPKIVQNQTEHLVEIARYVSGCQSSRWDFVSHCGYATKMLLVLIEGLKQQLHSELKVAFQIMR